MRALFACGGTGGHIYPAIAIAEAMIKRYKADVFFAGSDYGMEKRIIEGKKFAFHAVTARPFLRKPTLQNFVNAFYVIKSLFDSAALVRKLRPDIVIGTGGFVSFPVVMAASIAGIRTLIHEPNTYPGIANRILGAFASRVTTGFAGTAGAFPAGKAVNTGNPVRESVTKAVRKKALKAFGLKPGVRTVLVMPGSRAAASINRAVPGALEILQKKYGKVQAIWMAGSADHKKAKEAAKKMTGVKVFEFIKDSGAAYAASDAAVLRAGASTLSEVAAAGVAAVLVPYPHATGNHQEKNAVVFERAGAAIVVKDRELSPEKLAGAIEAVMDKRTNARIRKNTGKIYRAKSAEKIADIAAKEAKK